MGAVVHYIDFVRIDMIGGCDVAFGELRHSGYSGAVTRKLREEIGHVSLVRGLEIVFAVLEIDIMDDCEGGHFDI